jgi:hypothetical protein
MPCLFFQNFTWFLEVNERSSLGKMVFHDKWAQVHRETWLSMNNGPKFHSEMASMRPNYPRKTWILYVPLLPGANMFPCCMGQTCSLGNFGPICKFCKENNKCLNLIFLTRQLGQASGAKLHKDPSFPINRVPRMESIGSILWGLVLESVAKSQHHPLEHHPFLQIRKVGSRN